MGAKTKTKSYAVIYQADTETLYTHIIATGLSSREAADQALIAIVGTAVGGGRLYVAESRNGGWEPV